MNVRRIRFIIYSLTLVIFGSYNELSKEQKSCSGTIIFPLQIQDSLSFKDLIDSVFYVRLETKKDALFGDITQLKILNDTIIIFDQRNNLVLTFNLNGDFIRNIGSIGGGPNERSSCIRISIDKKKYEILLLDTGKTRIFHYALNGDFISSEEAFVFPADFIVNGDQFIYYQDKSSVFFDQKSNYDLIVTKDKEILQKYIPFTEANFPDGSGGSLYEINDTVCFIDHLNGSVYSIVDGSLKPRICIDFSGNEMPLEFTKSEELCDLNRNKYSSLFTDFIESEMFVIFNYIDRGEVKKTIYNKIEKSYFNFSTATDYRDYQLVAFEPVCCYNEYVLSFVEPSKLVWFMDMGSKRNLDLFYNNKLSKLATEIKSDDNLILACYKFKTK